MHDYKAFGLVNIHILTKGRRPRTEPRRGSIQPHLPVCIPGGLGRTWELPVVEATYGDLK